MQLEISDTKATSELQDDQRLSFLLEFSSEPKGLLQNQKVIKTIKIISSQKDLCQ